MSCDCSICEVFEKTSDDLTKAAHRAELMSGRQKLHNLYQGKGNMSDDGEEETYRKLMRLAEEDGLKDLKQTLQHLVAS
ncbi:hypothetical protein A1O7_09632 [Cladophialophora yegresii CBS 114405]|uniref:Uncharacterized protein n=1 Tax=Cladophialophora yegresii CBS 114405 TaxID=1182544 RepID=W9W6X1_9EURO|nr:uncharacterized protein A1O7_09632 [Cladophialophora yegresii CBS 114405]EXJ54294.1 hypothetical protein A1O7_09632 [Cladophialophora yegresii CBS 114405]